MENRYNRIKIYWSIILICLIAPILFYYIIPILPTHDDWTSTTSPDFSPFFTKEHFLFYGYHWRPFDTWIGYIAGRNPMLLYPSFNHILVVIGHILCSLLVFRLLIILGYQKTSVNIATFYFFITPATMATVLAVDSQNQVFALIWGIMAFIVYARIVKYKYIVWPLLVFIATLSKENGLMWALICPILAYGFDIIDSKTLKKDLFIGIATIIVYFVAIAILPKDINIHPEYVPDALKIVKNITKFGFTSFITVDYVYLLHSPKRNLILAVITIVLSAPLFYYIFLSKTSLYKHKKTIFIIVSMLIAAAPHLLTVFSMMHTYAALPFVTLLIANTTNEYKEKTKPVIVSFLLFVISAIMIDIHLWHESYESGLTGKKMAKETIEKTGSPVKNVYLIIIEEDFTKLSSFCTVPYEAFGWGLAALYETNYKWPENIKDTIIERSPNAIIEAQNTAKKVLKEDYYDCVWIVNHRQVDIMK